MARSIYKNSIVYVLLGFLAPSVNFFLLPVYSKILLPAEFGIITLASLLQMALANLVGLGLNAAFVRLYFDEDKSRNGVRVLFTNAFILQIISGLLVHGLLILVGDGALRVILANDKFTYSTFGIYIGITSIAINLHALVLSWDRNFEKIIPYSFWAILFFLLPAAGMFIGIVNFKMGALGNVEGRMWGSLVPLFLFCVINFKRFVVNKTTYSLGRKMLSYGLPLVPYLLLALIYTNIDKVLLERFTLGSSRHNEEYALKMLGLYGFAFLIASVVEIFINALQSATYPSLFRELIKENRNSSAISEIYSLFILTNLTIVTFIASFGGVLISVFINNNYRAVVAYLPLLCIMAIPRIFGIIFMNTLSFYKKSKAMPLASALSVVSICFFGYLLIPLYQVTGLIIAVILSQTCQMFMFIYLNHFFKVTTKESTYLTKEKSMALQIAVAIIISTVLYNLVSPNPAWYILIFVVYLVNIFLSFRHLLHRAHKLIFKQAVI